LARIIFYLVTTRQEFDDTDSLLINSAIKNGQETKLRARAKAMGYELIPLEQAG